MKALILPWTILALQQGCSTSREGNGDLFISIIDTRNYVPQTMTYYRLDGQVLIVQRRTAASPATLVDIATFHLNNDTMIDLRKICSDLLEAGIKDWYFDPDQPSSPYRLAIEVKDKGVRVATNVEDARVDILMPLFVKIKAIIHSTPIPIWPLSVKELNAMSKDEFRLLMK